MKQHILVSGPMYCWFSILQTEQSQHFPLSYLILSHLNLNTFDVLPRKTLLNMGHSMYPCDWTNVLFLDGGTCVGGRWLHVAPSIMGRQCSWELAIITGKSIPDLLTGQIKYGQIPWNYYCPADHFTPDISFKFCGNVDILWVLLNCKVFATKFCTWHNSMKLSCYVQIVVTIKHAGIE